MNSYYSMSHDKFSTSNRIFLIINANSGIESYKEPHAIQSEVICYRFYSPKIYIKVSK
jgi:hypothetical protein